MSSCVCKRLHICIMCACVTKTKASSASGPGDNNDNDFSNNTLELRSAPFGTMLSAFQLVVWPSLLYINMLLTFAGL